ncbi:MAG TPA: hypothetical protein VGI16_07035 [Candidatus Acidoferrum sp.]|jgi:hypothetical protein
MLKFTASLVCAGAFLVAGAGLQAQTKTQLTVKKGAPELVASSGPVMAPLSAGTAFNASLVEGLDTRKSRAGEPVVAEVTENVTYERSVIFPKGTKIVGHVVRASSGHGRTASALFVQFDKAILADGQEVILNAGIQALAVGSFEAASAEDNSGNDTADAPETPLRGVIPAEEPPTGSLPSSNAAVMSTTYMSRTLRDASSLPDSAPQGGIAKNGLFTTDSKGAFGRPDIKVYTPTSDGSHGTVLLSMKKNMHLENGTRLLLVVQPPPAAIDSDGTPANGVSDISE